MVWLRIQLIALLLATSKGQESPSILVDIFDSSQSLRSDVCERQREVWSGLRSLPEALNGLNLSVALPDFQNDFSQDALFRLVNGKIDQDDPGLLVTMMDEVARRSGFTWRNSFGTFRPLNPEVDGNRTWADILFWSIDVYDISAEIWGRSIERIGQGVSFPLGWYDSSVVFVDRLEVEEFEEVVNVWAFLTPFNSAVWFINMGFVALTGLMYWCFERMNADTDENGQKDTPVTCIYHAAMVITGNFGFRPNTHASRFLSCSWTLWVLVVTSAYVANLASHLVTKEVRTMRIETIEAAIDQNAVICVEAGAIVEAVLRASYPELRLLPKATNDELFASLRVDVDKGGCDVVAHRINGVKLYERNQAINYDCSISSTKRVLAIIPGGFATAIDTGKFRCTSLISAVLDYHIQMMIDDGFVEQAWKVHMSKVGTIDCLFKFDQSSGGGYSGKSAASLRNGDVGGIFVLHVVLAILSIHMAIFQKFDLRDLYRKAKDNQQSRFQLSKVDRLKTQSICHDSPEELVPDASSVVINQMEIENKDEAKGQDTFPSPAVCEEEKSLSGS